MKSALVQTVFDTGAGALRPEDGAEDLRAGLHRLFLSVVADRAPDVARYLRTGAVEPIPSGSAAVPYLQAMNIWFQLQKIAEENAAMRARRRAEADAGPSAVPGSFATVMDRISGQKGGKAALDAALERLSVVPFVYPDRATPGEANALPAPVVAGWVEPGPPRARTAPGPPGPDRPRRVGPAPWPAPDRPQRNRLSG